MLCKKCLNEKPPSEFYPKCKSECKVCARARIKSNNQTPERKAALAQYELMRKLRPERKKQNYETVKRRRAKKPQQKKAHGVVNMAIAKGRLKRQPCELCGEPKSEAHHDDYKKPYQIRWLCMKHHREWHKTNKAINE